MLRGLHLYETSRRQLRLVRTASEERPDRGVLRPEKKVYVEEAVY